MNKKDWKIIYRNFRSAMKEIGSIISNIPLKPASPKYQVKLLKERGFNSIEEFKQYYRKNETKQDHFIRNHNAPIEQDSYSFMPTAQQSLRLPNGKVIRKKPSDLSIGLYYARHQDEFFKYHEYNEFNINWLKKYVDILKSIEERNR